jgi:membrane-bound inhibitor of C-type lysozyme
MAKYGDSLVVFWDGESKGTYNMIYQMRKLSKPVEIVFYDNDSPEG